MQYKVDPISLRRPIAEIERWAKEMRLWFEPHCLPLPVITIQGGRREALGWFARSSWETRDGAILDEINFVPEHLHRDVFDIAETLLHELVHLANHVAQVKDCSSFQYHNAKFRDRAVSVGLVCERVERFGWAKTSLGIDLRDRVAGLSPDATAFDLFRLPPAARRPGGVTIVADSDLEDGGGVGRAVRVSRPQKKLAKWMCPGCRRAVWAAAGAELHALCLVCGGEWEREP
jgi:hypothetical protein